MIRRNFLQHSFLASLGAVWAKTLTGCAPTPAASAKGQPVVISTWDFGQAANAAAWAILQSGGRALDAVEAGARVPEGDPAIQSVGYGGFPDRDGRVTLDACIMDEKANCGSVMCLQHIMHPVSVARLVMEKTPHVQLVAEGALQFALANGFKKENLLTPESEKAWREWLKTANYQPEINVENQLDTTTLPGSIKNHDTIGILALDAAGHLSGACTTSGLSYKMYSRVGDSPIIGAGLFVDQTAGCATATGVGEEVVRICGAHTIVEWLRQGHRPEAACKEAIRRIVQRDPEKAKTMQVGFLALTPAGEFGAFALQKGFTYAVRKGQQDQLSEAKSWF